MLVKLERDLLYFKEGSKTGGVRGKVQVLVNISLFFFFFCLFFGFLAPAPPGDPWWQLKWLTKGEKGAGMWNTQLLLRRGPGPMWSLVGISQSPILAYGTRIPVSPRDLAGQSHRYDLVIVIGSCSYPVVHEIRISLGWSFFHHIAWVGLWNSKSSCLSLWRST